MNVSLPSTTLFLSLVLAISSLAACSTSDHDAPDSNDIQNAYAQQAGININVSNDKCQKKIDTSDGTHVFYDCTFTATAEGTTQSGEGLFTKSDGNWLVTPKN